MKHCCRDSTRRELLSNKLPSMLGTLPRSMYHHWCVGAHLGTNGAERQRSALARKSKRDMYAVDRATKKKTKKNRHTHSSRHADVASGVRRVCLPPLCDSEQTHRVMRSTAESQSAAHWEKDGRGRDRHSHTLYHVPRQSTNPFFFFSPQ